MTVTFIDVPLIFIAEAFQSSKFIFADEPTGNLDRESGSLVLDFMAEQKHENNVTMVMMTHDREVALRTGYIYDLAGGRICKFLDVEKYR